MAPVSNCIKLHPDRVSGPCAVCHMQRISDSYWHIEQADPENHLHAQLVGNLREIGVQDKDCVCRTCKFHFQDKTSCSDFPDPKKAKLNHCCVPNCTKVEQRYHQNTKFSHPDVQNHLGLILSDECQLHNIQLCHTHYSKLYNILCLSSLTCCVCDQKSNPRLLPKSFRKVGDGEFGKAAIQYGSIIADREIGSTDFLCRFCGRCIEKYQKSESFGKNKGTLGFSNLFQIFENVQVVPSNECNDEDTDTVEDSDYHCDFDDGGNDFDIDIGVHSCDIVSLSETMLFLRNILSDDQPILLSTLYKKYVGLLENHCATSAPCHGNFHLHLHTPEWLKQRILKTIGPSVVLSSIDNNPRYGTMIRHRESILENMLHKMLFFQNVESDKCVEEISQLDTTPSCSISQKMSEVANYLNTMLLDFASTRAEEDETVLDEFTFEDEIKCLPPQVWNFLLQLSFGANEKKRFQKRLLKSQQSFSWSDHYMEYLYKSDILNKSKMLRRFFILSSIIFCINKECYFPVHLLLSDVIDKFTVSSTECLTILSRFGVTVSKATLLRYQTWASKQEMAAKTVVLSSSFCVASIDNIDRNASYAAVKSSQHGRGFHGTSVQAVEPLPLTCANNAVIRESTGNTISHRRRARTLCTEDIIQYHSVPATLSHNQFTMSRQQYCFQSSLEDFRITQHEFGHLDTLKRKIFCYMLIKTLSAKEHKQKYFLPDLRDSMKLVCPSVTEQSNVHFTALIPRPADSKDTLYEVLNMLKCKHGVGELVDKLVVAGDGKTYDLLVNLKQDYQRDLDWALPYLGEWHLLKNLQAPLFKIYMDGGLKHLLKMYHHGATSKAVLKATSFEKSHQFLLQTWEALYRHCLSKFLEGVGGSEVSFAGILQRDVKDESECLGLLKQELKSPSDICSELHIKFDQFCSNLNTKSGTFQFWNNFVHRDMFLYVGLYLAVRGRDFSLRNVCIRLLAPIFHALDRHVYLRLTPFHLADLKENYPFDYLQDFDKGGFTVSFTGKPMSSSAFDEAHEQGVNKNVKMAMTATSEENIARLVQYLPHRARIIKNLNEQILNNKERKESESSSEDHERNVLGYERELMKSNMFSNATLTSADRVQNIFSAEVGDSTVSSNLLTFYDRGEEAFQNYMKCVVLRTPGTTVNSRKRMNLKTFEKKKATVHNQRKEISDQRLQISCLRRQIAFSRQLNTPVSHFQQFIALPRAICTPDGLPNKPNKAVISQLYEKRYPGVFTPVLPTSLSIHTAYIVDGMFVLQARPCEPQKTFGDYITCLFRRWVILPMAIHHASEVHIVFDHPHRHQFSPKDVERSRRDANCQPLIMDENITATTKLPPKDTPWVNFLGNRSLKRLLVNLISDMFLDMSKSLHHGKVVILAGGFDGDRQDKSYIGHVSGISEASQYFSNHEEADTRVWFHGFITRCSRVIIYSPDRDVMNIGLPLVSGMAGKEVYVHLRANVGNELYCNVSALAQSFQSDLSFQEVGEHTLIALPAILQMLFICSGCDYVSSFVKHTKRKFLETLIRDCKFITGSAFCGQLLILLKRM